MIKFLYLLIFGCLFGPLIPTYGQTTIEKDSLRQLHIQYALFDGSMKVVGKSGNVRMEMIRLFYSNRLFNNEDFTVDYLIGVDAIPHMTYPNSSNRNFPNRRIGVAFLPIGFSISLFPNTLLQPFTNIRGGAFAFDQPYPNPWGSSLNFQYEWTLGIRYSAFSYLHLFTSYTFYHISNAQLARVNPGIDMNLGLLGIAFTIE